MNENRIKMLMNGETIGDELECFVAMKTFLEKLPGSALNKFETKLENMLYDDFLNTRYWQIVANYVKFSNGWACKYCNEYQDKAIHTHHISYDNKGSEWRHLESLQPACPNCHKQM